MPVHALTKAHEAAERIFRDILPVCGMAVREGQISLCHSMLDTFWGKRIALCDAGVGVGKTIAYIIAAVLYVIYMPFDWNIRDYYGIDKTPQTFVISTSSIALQQAILEEHIPFLSEVLLEKGITNAPFHGQLRKGKAHYVCHARLNDRIGGANLKRKNDQQKKALFALRTQVDLDRVVHLSPFDRQKVCVPPDCTARCDDADLCAYHHHVQDMNSFPALFLVCNHNYFLAHMLHCHKGYRELLPPFRGVIIDEAHQLYSTVQSMYGMDTSHNDIEILLNELREMKQNSCANVLRTHYDKLMTMFIWLAKQKSIYRRPADCQTVIGQTIEILQTMLGAFRRCRSTMRLCGRISNALEVLRHFHEGDDRYYCFAEWDDHGKVKLCTVNKSYQTMLQHILWQKPYGMILASGTLAAGRDMTYLKNRLGLLDPVRVMETFTPSPFDYQHNSLLYFPHNMPSCKDTSSFRRAAAYMVKQLIEATAGHTLILCTSYTEMRELHQQLRDMHLTYPLFAMYRNGSKYLKDFLESGNGVLLASGPCWEGMDFPGDIVSSLIIPRLPFPRRDALHEGEKERYHEIEDFISAVAQPEMLVKLKQGFGRGIRLMTDACVTSILDRRAAPGGSHHEAVISALPECPLTQKLDDVSEFIRLRKNADYYFAELFDE